MKPQIVYCSTIYPFYNNRLALLFHKKLKKWVPPGGKIEPNETPQEAAIRECLEETGLVVKLVGIKEDYSTSLINCVGMEKNMTSENEGHLDFIFTGTVDNDKIVNQEGFDDIRWFSLEEIEEVDTFESVKYWARRELVSRIDE